MRRSVEIKLSGAERSELERLARARKIWRALSDRAHIVLLAVKGLTNVQIANLTARKWRNRFAEYRTCTGSRKLYCELMWATSKERAGQFQVSAPRRHLCVPLPPQSRGRRHGCSSVLCPDSCDQAGGRPPVGGRLSSTAWLAYVCRSSDERLPRNEAFSRSRMTSEVGLCHIDLSL